ncbi:hypothetical protein RFI_16012 [Reticulomyxa filosa]|uniref:Uncharacterized protein n=1 Tax=Reticulomyxa filosa TaxID=46433 RepID=X6N571_RETFI|nr:hypothetical protein RFI_16012 [Reticulomyxa filosa]|eukprot:ETO21191.1 hypothetical protein RFI_16012 [Reticulomyxa filosa]
MLLTYLCLIFIILGSEGTDNTFTKIVGISLGLCVICLSKAYATFVLSTEHNHNIRPSNLKSNRLYIDNEHASNTFVVNWACEELGSWNGVQIEAFVAIVPENNLDYNTHLCFFVSDTTLTYQTHLRSNVFAQSYYTYTSGTPNKKFFDWLTKKNIYNFFGFAFVFALQKKKKKKKKKIGPENKTTRLNTMPLSVLVLILLGGGYVCAINRPRSNKIAKVKENEEWYHYKIDKYSAIKNRDINVQKPLNMFSKRTATTELANEIQSQPVTCDVRTGKTLLRDNSNRQLKGFAQYFAMKIPSNNGEVVVATFTPLTKSGPCRS